MVTRQHHGSMASMNWQLPLQGTLLICCVCGVCVARAGSQAAEEEGLHQRAEEAAAVPPLQRTGSGRSSVAESASDGAAAQTCVGLPSPGPHLRLVSGLHTALEFRFRSSGPVHEPAPDAAECRAQSRSSLCWWPRGAWPPCCKHNCQPAVR